MKKTREQYYKISHSWGTVCDAKQCNNWSMGYIETSCRIYGALCYEHEKKYQRYIEQPTLKERINIMAKTLRERVRAALRSKEERLLIETGFTYESGALTEDGRKVLADVIFEDEGIRARIVELAGKLKEDDCKKSK